MNELAHSRLVLVFEYVENDLKKCSLLAPKLRQKRHNQEMPGFQTDLSPVAAALPTPAVDRLAEVTTLRNVREDFMKSSQARSPFAASLTAYPSKSRETEPASGHATPVICLEPELVEDTQPELPAGENMLSFGNQVVEIVEDGDCEPQHCGPRRTVVDEVVPVRAFGAQARSAFRPPQAIVRAEACALPTAVSMQPPDAEPAVLLSEAPLLGPQARLAFRPPRALEHPSPAPEDGGLTLLGPGARAQFKKPRCLAVPTPARAGVGQTEPLHH
ncbi:hypothetical protein AK812_SmicGene39541 [Symbiodinium microadriaticum]|uniref:Uncharacterized protein n=1 Tax=Symbiodinium microadriaticum TaxID=2951 RepID=A0A1Q9CAZ6_SYMMI|nr:hypothetical protein AK812_SmicGene39541 [Symbiodinium microadriaticum]